MRLTSITGIFGAVIFSLWELLKFVQPDVSVSDGEHGRLRIPKLIQVAEADTRIPSETQSSQPSQVKDNDSSDHCRKALETKVELLKSARSFLENRKNYTANISKQEVVKGELLDEQCMLMKVRVNPFSVYLHWTVGDVGREVIFVEGKNSGKMIAHDGGWKARLPAFHLTPDCSLAMRDARYPITCAGLVFLIDTMLQVHESDLREMNFESCEIADNHEFDRRPAIMVTTKYKSKQTSPNYRKSITLFDRETSVPVSTEHFEWPHHNTSPDADRLDESTLIERYSFHDLTFDQNVTDEDFDRGNKQYRFR